jgi:predicted amidohydrolase
MRISVLQQQLISLGYDFRHESPPIEVLRAKANENVEACLAMIADAAGEGADLVVTTETVNSALALGDVRYRYPDIYEGLDGELVARFAAAARQHGIHLVAGLLLTIDKKTYNCAVLFDDRGEIVGVHRKVHMPAGEEFCVTAGDRFDVYETRLGRIGMLVCWDMQFPEAARELALGGADLIVCPTLGWENVYGLARAYENSVTVAAAMNGWEGGYGDVCDPACIVDNMGRIVAAGPRAGGAVVTADVDIAKEPAPQYHSELFYPSHSMRKTRFSQRRPDTYRLISESNAATPLYNRYFKDK